MTEAEQIMKRCQAGTRNYEEANNLHAACYGIIGKLLAQTEQEPVADDFFRMIADRNPKPFPLPQRTWSGLTEEDFSAINQSCFTKLQAATSAESILKEKNT